jgi:Protein of unknown function (DUF2934)
MVANVFPESEAEVHGSNDLHEAVRRRAEEIYEKSGRIPGRDTENWIQAEEEIRREAERYAGRRTAVVVKVDGIDYVGEYDFASAAGYTAGEFSTGDPVAVRFEEDKMYVKRSGGKELETRVVKAYS